LGSVYYIGIKIVVVGINWSRVDSNGLIVKKKNACKLRKIEPSTLF